MEDKDEDKYNEENILQCETSTLMVVHIGVWILMAITNLSSLWKSKTSSIISCELCVVVVDI